MTNQTKQKTAIRQAIEWAKQSFDYYNDPKAHAFVTKLETLEPVNEQQIAEAHEQGYDDYQYGQRNGNNYFNETFEKP